MRPRIVIFDWDGTLADSHAKITDCLRRALAEVGGPTLGEERLRAAIGLGLPETAAHLHPRGDATFRAEFVAAYRAHWLARNAEGVTMFAGARDTLHALERQGFALAVATGKSRAGLARELRQSGLERLLPVSRCADETASKPDPRMVHEILAETGIAPDDAVVVGDTSFDLEMAQRAGTRSIGVSWGAHPPALLSTYDPLAIVDDLPQLLDVLT